MKLFKILSIGLILTCFYTIGKAQKPLQVYRAFEYSKEYYPDKKSWAPFSSCTVNFEFYQYRIEMYNTENRYKRNTYALIPAQTTRSRDAQGNNIIIYVCKDLEFGGTTQFKYISNKSGSEYIYMLIEGYPSLAYKVARTQ